MQITITIPDEQWQEFQQLAQEAVEMRWNGSYEDFATYIMAANFENYLESQKRKQEKKMKKALSDYDKSLKKEQEAIEVKTKPVVPLPTKEPEPEIIAVPMTDGEISARIEKIQTVPVKKRTLEQANELNELIEIRKKRKV
jgi:hypothetical protein